jgi:hypothetical protein
MTPFLSDEELAKEMIVEIQWRRFLF